MAIRSLVGLFLATILWTTTPEPAAAGVHLVAEIMDLRLRSDASRTAQFWVDADRVRIDDSWQGPGVTWSTMLYDGSEDVFLGLDEKQSTYVRIDRPTLTAIATQVRMLRVMLNAQMNRLSVEQRATAARMLGGSEISTQPVPPLVTRDTGDHEMVGGRDCRLVEIWRGDRSVGMAWVADWDQVALEDDSLGVFRKLAGLLGELNGTVDVGGVPPQLFEVFDGFGGFPMRVRWNRHGQVMTEVRFISVMHQEVPSQHFEVPAAYRQRGLTSRAPASKAPAP